jgi:membrane protein DedA with SNARE-associated domain
MALEHHDLTSFISAYGYWSVGGVVALESMGLPVPGETMLIAAAIYAGTTHQLDIGLVIAAAAAGAIIGDNIGYWIGREAGYRLLLRYGPYVGLTQGKLKVGIYLFQRHGGTIVFFGRFIALLRALAALLAGANRMAWPRFLFFNAAGGIVWTTLYGAAAYRFGDRLTEVSRPLGLALTLAAIVLAIVGIIALRRFEARLHMEAERALPGPLAPSPTPLPARRDGDTS